MRPVEAGQSALLIGAGGTWKTHLTRGVVQHFQDVGHEVETVAFTRLAAQNIVGITIHHFLHGHPRCTGWLVVGEASFVPAIL